VTKTIISSDRFITHRSYLKIIYTYNIFQKVSFIIIVVIQLHI